MGHVDAARGGAGQRQLPVPHRGCLLARPSKEGGSAARGRGGRGGDGAARVRTGELLLENLARDSKRD